MELPSVFTLGAECGAPVFGQRLQRSLHVEAREAQLAVFDPARDVSSVCAQVDSSWVDLLVSITRISLAGICLVTGPF